MFTQVRVFFIEVKEEILCFKRTLSEASVYNKYKLES